MPCAGSGRRWVKEGRKTRCPVCGKPISHIGGHPDQPIPKH